MSGALLLGLSCLLLCFLKVKAHAALLQDETLCQTLNVGHLPNDGGNVEDVSIKLVTPDGESSKDCYDPDTTYNMVITSMGKSIRGLLVLQDQDKAYGDFPYLPPRTRLQDGLTQGFCGEHSVSHNCFTECNLGTTITLPYHSPSDASKTLEFRYSIVYKKNEFVEDKIAEFAACLPEPACNSSDFQLTTQTSEVYERPGKKKLCKSNPRWTSNESRVITENNQNYTCKLDDPKVRKKNCSSGCDYNGKTLCCKIESIEYEPRNFTCEPHDAKDATIYRTFTVREERKCVCYYCSDVCPKPTLATPEYSSGEDKDSDNDTELHTSVVPVKTNSSL